MQRRAFVVLASSAVAVLPLPVLAQQGQRVPRIGYLALTFPPGRPTPNRDAFIDGLRDRGYIVGKNIEIEYRFADRSDQLNARAAELVGMNVDIIVTYASGVPAAKRATTTIPIVMLNYGDAVATGMVASLARPGGNITGSTFFAPEVSAKRLALLKEAVPSIRRVGVFLVRDNAINGPMLTAMEAAARSLSVELYPVEVRTVDEFEGAFTTWKQNSVDALVVHENPVFYFNLSSIAVLSHKHGMPSIGGAFDFPPAGGLMGYGVDSRDPYRRGAYFVDRILRGTSPAELPVEQTSKFHFVINLKTAKALGIEMPPSLLLRAEQVIE